MLDSNESAAQNESAVRLIRAARGGRWSEAEPLLAALVANASGSGDMEQAIANETLFRDLIEPLHDSFEPADREAYLHFFAWVLTIFRRLPPGAGCDELLRAAGLNNGRAIFERAALLRRPLPFSPELLKDCERVVIPTRVTIGADIAITGRIIAWLRASRPRLQPVLLGSRHKLEQIFGGDTGLSYEDATFQRAGTLSDKIAVWLELMRCRHLTNPQNFIVLDPESRISQNGLLPLPHSNEAAIYRVFDPLNSRWEADESLGAKVDRWLAATLGGLNENQSLPPPVKLRRQDLETMAPVAAELRGMARPVVVLNFGVGANQRKRLDADFEHGMVRAALDRQWTVVLDRGDGNESERAAALLARLSADGCSFTDVRETDDGSLHYSLRLSQLTAFCGGIGKLGALLQTASLYAGYDSMGQHLAVALGVQTITVFTGYANQRFKAHWTPYGAGPVTVIDVPDSTEASKRKALAGFCAALEAPLLSLPGQEPMDTHAISVGNTVQMVGNEYSKRLSSPLSGEDDDLESAHL